MHKKSPKSTLIWEVDPLLCPKCTGEMRLISFIYKRPVIKKILTHLDLYEGGTPGQRAPPTLIKEKYIDQIEHVPYDDGWPGHEEPSREI